MCWGIEEMGWGGGGKVWKVCKIEVENPAFLIRKGTKKLQCGG